MPRRHDSGAILRGLRKVFDSSSGFMTGHQIKSTRSESRKRNVPVWSLDDEFIRKMLLKSFPLLATNELQRKRAGRWLLIIQLYFKKKMSSREIGEEIGEKTGTVLSLTRSISRASRGLRANGCRATKVP